MIKLSRPKAYGEIKPLCGKTAQPIRCMASHIVVPEIEDRPDCIMYLTKAGRTDRCDWPGKPQL